MISVSLQSSDIIGLGFNISGSLSEGIFVSQVHNRGPASESGKIKVGKTFIVLLYILPKTIPDSVLASCYSLGNSHLILI